MYATCLASLENKRNYILIRLYMKLIMKLLGQVKEFIGINKYNVLRQVPVADITYMYLQYIRKVWYIKKKHQNNSKFLSIILISIMVCLHFQVLLINICL